MSTQQLSFPAPVQSDPNEVAHALEVGSAEWGRGDRREAVRWVHRAADAAEAAGDDRRAVGLARAAADLMSSLGAESSSPKPRDEGAALAPFDDFNDQTIVDSPAIQAARTMQHSAVTISERPSKPPPPPRPATQRPSAVPLGTTSSAAPRPRTALRVAVVRNKDNERVIIANVLDEGAPAPPGTSEALLVLLDPNAALARDGA